MLRFGKVNKIKATKDEKGNVTSYGTEYAKGSQKDYEKKVKDFFKYCQGFDKALKELQPEEGKVITAKDIKDCFNKSFKGYYSKLSKRLGLFSRTTRVLKGMDKELSKLGEKGINEKGVSAKLRDAFEYKREMPTGKLIKRSTIDDKVIYGFFNGTVPEIIGELVKKAGAGDVQQAAAAEKNAEQKAAEELKFIEDSLKGAKFENRFKVLVDKIGEITNDLNEINGEKGKRKDYPEDEKAFKKNDNFIAKIREEVKKVEGKIGNLKTDFNAKKKELKENKEVDINECKKTIRNIKNDVEKCSKEVKKLKSDTEKAIKEFSNITKKIKKEANAKYTLEDGTLTINGQDGLKAYYDVYVEDVTPYRNNTTSIIMNNIGNISKINAENLGGLFHSFGELISVKTSNLSGTISEGAFNQCYNLESFNESGNYKYIIPESVGTIGDSAFAEAGKKVADGFSANVESETIGKDAFQNSGLSKINLPNATTIKEGAFTGCNKLTEVTLGQDNLDNISEKAFDNNDKLIIYVKTGELQEKLKEKLKNSYRGNVEVKSIEI